MHSFLSALKYLAENKVVHRDLKPENLILATKGDDNDLRIADFGFATFLTEKEPLLYLRCGSPGYVGPEVLTDEGYGCAADVFSSGAIMYVLLTGKQVFRAKSVTELLELNKNCEITFPE
jgi:serine/threonine protein kinase